MITRIHISGYQSHEITKYVIIVIQSFQVCWKQFPTYTYDTDRYHWYLTLLSPYLFNRAFLSLFLITLLTPFLVHIFEYNYFQITGHYSLYLVNWALSVIGFDHAKSGNLGWPTLPCLVVRIYMTTLSISPKFTKIVTYIFGWRHFTLHLKLWHDAEHF